MKTYPLNFRFKGNRDYVHGTDIYDNVNKCLIDELGLKNITKIDMTIHSVMRSNLLMEIDKNVNVVRKENVSVILSFCSNGDNYVAQLSETGNNVIGRYEYKEEEISDACTTDTDKKEISLHSAVNFTDIEIYVDMNKALLNALYPDINGKWFLTRFQIDKYEERSTYNSISIVLKHNFNFKLTKSQIIKDGKEVGFIYFTLT